MRITVPTEIRAAIDRGALVVLNHSGGKDSQAMTAAVRGLVPAAQLVVVHAELPGVEWADTEAHARLNSVGLEFHTVRAGKTFVDMVRRRGRFPSPSQRQCTSDLKRDPINTWLRRLCRDRGILEVVQCLGLRAEESTRRARQPVVKLDKRMSKAGRTVRHWHPILDWTVDEVFAAIAAAGQAPHWAYGLGMTRLSCAFCIMASRADMTIAARHNPELYRELAQLEQDLGFTLQNGRTLEETTGIALADLAVAAAN